MGGNLKMFQFKTTPKVAYVTKRSREFLLPSFLKSNSFLVHVHKKKGDKIQGVWLIIWGIKGRGYTTQRMQKRPKKLSEGILGCT